MQKQERQLVAQYASAHHEKTLRQVAKLFGISLSSVCNYTEEFSVRRTPPRPARRPVAEILAEIEATEGKSPTEANAPEVK